MKKVISALIILVMATCCFISVSAFQSAGTIEIGDVSSDIQSVVKPDDYVKVKEAVAMISRCGNVSEE